MQQGKLILDPYTKLSSSLQRGREEAERYLVRYLLGNVAAQFAQWGAPVFKNQIYKTK